MKFKSIILSILLALTVSFETKSNTLQTLKRYCIGTIAAATGVYCLYKYCAHLIKEKINNKIIDETSDAIVLALTTNAEIVKLPQAEQEQKFKEKAKFIQMRNRVMAKLQAVVDAYKAGKLTDKFPEHRAYFAKISAAHIKNIEKYINNLNLLLKPIDRIRNSVLCIKNPYEKQKFELSAKDELVEYKMFQSIIITAKPDNECNAVELDMKKEMLTRRKRIQQEVAKKLVAKQSQKINLMANFLTCLQ